jgi:predicted methyltransferase
MCGLRSPEFARRAFLDEVEPAEVELTQLNGFSIYTSAQDLAVGQHVRTGTYEPAVTALFRRILKPGMTVIDVGANIGFYSLLAASIVGTDGYVLAVEPNVQNVRLLEASRRVNSFGQLIVAYAAAGRNTGVLALNTSYSNGTTRRLSKGGW